MFDVDGWFYVCVKTLCWCLARISKTKDAMDDVRLVEKSQKSKLDGELPRDRFTSQLIFV